MHCSLSNLYIHGRSQDLAWGKEFFFFKIWEYACREAMRFVRGGGGLGACPPPRKFYKSGALSYSTGRSTNKDQNEECIKWCNLVRFGVYLDQILSLNFFLNYLFLYKKFKNTIFYITISKITIFYLKNKYFRYMLSMW